VREDELRIVPRRDGTFGLRLTRPERAVLRELPRQLREILDRSDPAAVRLFPPAYQDDPHREAQYREMVHDQLVAGRRRSADLMEATIDADRLDREELAAWVGALNDLRLVLGTRLEVTEDEVSGDDPEDESMALYHYLGWLEAQAVDALAAELPG
jgi:hypothetical protein